MPARFRYPRRVQFHETDMAGIVHFSAYFKYMEEAEHALWRSVGMSISPVDAQVGFPRVSATCDFKAPLKFEDECEVDIEVQAIGRRSITYACILRRGDLVVATGRMTSVCVVRDADAVVRSTDLPEAIVTRLR